MPRADRQAEPGSTGRGETVVLAPDAAVNETERRLCGPGAVSRPAVAEGMAHQGRRAATLLAQAAAGPLGSDTASTRVPWVHHRFGAGPTSGFAFELDASLAQDAVDHCLVAHDLARRVGAAGVCRLAVPQAGMLDRVVLPDQALLKAFENTEPPTVAPRQRTEEAILTDAVLAFRRAAEVTGRPLFMITVDGPENPEVALLVSGAARRDARCLARALERDGLRCGVVCVHLLRPFPTAALSHVIGGVKRLLLVPGGAGFVEAARRAAIEGGLTAVPVLGEPLASDAAIDAVREALDLDGRSSAAREDADGRSLVLTARPSGWAERFLLDVARRIAPGDSIRLSMEHDALVFGRRPDAPEPPAQIALCAHPTYLESTRLLLRLDQGAVLVIVAAGPLPVDWWGDLQPDTRALVLGLGLRLHWLDLSASDGADPTDPETVRRTMIDAFLTAGAADVDGMPHWVSGDDSARAALTRVAVEALESARPAPAPGVSPKHRSPPRMPAVEERDDPGWRAAVRHFHLTGEGAHSAAEPTSAEPLRPFVLEALDTTSHRDDQYPIFVDAGTDPEEAVAVPFERWVSRALDRLESENEGTEIVTPHLDRLCAAAGKILSRVTGPVEPSAALMEIAREFERGFDLSAAARSTLHAETERLRGRLAVVSPESGLIDLDERTLAYLHTSTIRQGRRRRREELLDETRSLTRRLEELISIDDGHAPERVSAESVESSLGAHAADLLDPEKLAESIRRQRGPRRLDKSRRLRIERALATLRAGFGEDVDTDVILVRPESDPTFEDLPGVHEVIHPRGLGTAIGMFDGLAARFTELFRALRIARLEIDGAYDPHLHDDPLSRLDWQGLLDDELLVLPRLVVLETDARLRGAGLGALSELLRSGRPVHVLVAQTTSDFRLAESWQGLSGFHPGLGYLAVAHREAFVVESSLARPDRLVRDLKRMAGSLRPGVAFVAVPVRHTGVPVWTQLLAAEQGRVIPYFTYDPEAGSSWADCLDLRGNPQPGLPWPVHGAPHLDTEGHETLLEQRFSFAHAVALDPAYRDHFRILPEEAWSPEQLELADYLTAPLGVAARKIPFIWVVRENRLARAVITRELAYATRDRLRAWRILQQLAAPGEDARPPLETTTIAEPPADEPVASVEEAGDANELEKARAEAVRAAMERLARRLVGVDDIPVSTALPALDPAAANAAAGGITDTGEPDAAEAEAVSIIEEAYIDTALCTSCADCININPQLFRYDENKQAFITDVKLGTYAQLVKAAEKCPARCIHPGLPVAGDRTASDALVSRAAKFN